MPNAHTPLNRRTLFSLAGAALVIAAATATMTPAAAHHGWTWAEDANAEISGTIVAAKLGNPHGELTLTAADGAQWIVEVGQPWRNQRAGLKDEMLAKGVKLTVTGHKHSDPNKRVFKAEKLLIDGKTFDLYPDRN